MTKWSKRQRLEATILGEKPDRLPVALWRHWPGDDQDAAALAASHLKWQQDYDWDLIKVSPSSSFCIQDWGVKDQWEGSVEGTRTYTERVVHKPEDWEKLTVLDPKQGMLATQLNALKLLGEELRKDPAGETPFIATIFSPLAQAKNIAGNTRLLSHMRSHPQAVRSGLETITKSVIAYLEEAKEIGISGIYYAIQHARYSLLSPVEYQSFGRPYDEEILAVASDLWLNMVHIHGDDDIMFDLVADYPVQILNWHDRDTGLTLKEGLEQSSGAVCGGISRWSLYQDSPYQLVAEARESMDQTGGYRHILGVGCVAMTNTPLRNLRALRSFVENK